MKKYLLSTGKSTDKVERYILDLFSIYMATLPGDVPGSDIGFDFIVNGVKKDELMMTIKQRLKTLISNISKKVGNVANIVIESIVFVSESKVKVTIKVNEVTENYLVTV